MLYEVTAAGFNAEDDSTDDRVFWISAPNRDAVAAVIADTGATLHPDLVAVGEPDFVLPPDALALQSRLLEFASAERNKNRAV